MEEYMIPIHVIKWNIEKDFEIYILSMNSTLICTAARHAIKLYFLDTFAVPFTF